MEETEGAAPLRQPKEDGTSARYSSTKRYSEILRDFDNLELSLVNTSVDELLPDMDCQSTDTPDTTLDYLASEDVDNTLVCHDGEEKEGGMSAQDADVALCRSEGGVELALQYAKMWCRYAKDLLTWMDKRISLEQEFAKNIMKAADTAKSSIAHQDLMPLHSIYSLALEEDIKSSKSAKHTMELLQQRCYQYLSAKRNEIDKWRREFKEQWTREQKKMNDVVAALKRARQQYVQRCEDLEKAKAMTAKGVDEASGSKTIDKRRKSQDDAQTKVTESESLYRQCVHEAKVHQDDLEKVKEKIIVHMRKLICQGDTVLKEVTVNMFFFQRQQMEPIPQSYQNLEQTCRPSEPGEPYLRYVFKNCGHEQPLPTYTFQEFIPQCKRSPTLGRRKVSNPLMALQDSLSDGKRTGYSDSDSIGGSLESLSSPAHGNKLLKAPSTGTVSSDDLDEKDISTEAECSDPLNDSNGGYSKVRTTSRAALTHRLKKTKSKMSKCKQCDNFILVNGIECEECGFTVHRKCLDLCQTECERRRGYVFGIEFSILPREQPQDIPFVVQLCTDELESRALKVQGIYRVSGSKPRILKLCHAFETQRDQVDLSDLSPHDITSVLKLFFKDLPEPLMTFDLYNDFIGIGKEIQRLSEKNHSDATAQIVESVVTNLKQVLARLPLCNYSTLQYMIAHLNRISECFEENKMSPGNLGIVFGPTLLRPLVSGDISMIALLESSYQALLVEFMISNYDHIFSPVQRQSEKPSPAQEPDPADECEANTQERPRSLESRTFKQVSNEGYISDTTSSSEAVDQLIPEFNDQTVLAIRNVAAAQPDHLDELDAYVPTQRSHFSRQTVKHSRHSTTKVHMADYQPVGNNYVTVGEIGILEERAYCNSSVSTEILIQTPPKINMSQSGSLDSTSYASQAHPSACESKPGTQLDRAVHLSEFVTSSPNSQVVISTEIRNKGGNMVHKKNNQCNNTPNEGELTEWIQRPPAMDRNIQVALSGLKLRRSNLGKVEQLYFV